MYIPKPWRQTVPVGRNQKDQKASNQEDKANF